MVRYLFPMTEFCAYPTWDKPLFLENIFPNIRVIVVIRENLPVYGMVMAILPHTYRRLH
ncbi:hypothetical protein HMPREF0004_1750 [Achromobacter piechaudii ATCC 43553]|uniref:Uncharacterized protein n=1 Tax=Achromobacter piechaudii ATCC 43553 TaxID=742159 RepID=D4X8F3_9BURK|nr:hypothetical protein HMPREF0004_1750 [Achromobacter piechaudii ATCC 43553]